MHDNANVGPSQIYENSQSYASNLSQQNNVSRSHGNENNSSHNKQQEKCSENHDNTHRTDSTLHQNNMDVELKCFESIPNDDMASQSNIGNPKNNSNLRVQLYKDRA